MDTTLQVSGQSLTGLLAVLKPGELRGTEADWLGREPELVAGVGWHTASLAGRRLQPALALRALVILPGPPRSLIPLVLEASLSQYGHLSEQSRPLASFSVKHRAWPTLCGSALSLTQNTLESDSWGQLPAAGKESTSVKCYREKNICGLGAAVDPGRGLGWEAKPD